MNVFVRTLCAPVCLTAICLVAASNARAGSVCDAIPGNLVSNCGFETGTFSAWTLSGNDVPGAQGVLYGVEGVDPVDGIAPNSGNFQGFFADLVANSVTLSQTIATTPGKTYAISFYIAQDTTPGTGSAPNANMVSASFDGVMLTTLTDLPVEPYTKYSYQATAADASSMLNITIGNDLGEILLDDVSVAATSTASPEPASGMLMLGAPMVGALALVFRKRRAARQIRR